MQIEIEIRNGEYDPQILLPLWREALPELDERRIPWAYAGNPQGKGRLGLIKDAAENSYVGCCAIFPRLFFYQGRNVRGGVTGDFAVLKKWRSFGPAQKLQKALACESGFDLLLAFPNPQAEVVQLRAGFAPLADWVRYARTIPAPRPPVPAPWTWAVSSLSRLYWRWKWRGVGRKTSGERPASGGLGRGLEKLRVAGGERPDFFGSRDPAYLRWRFARHPYRPHGIFVLQGKSTAAPAGYIIFFMTGRTVYVQDFFLEDPEKDRGRLFTAFLQYCRRRGWQAVSVILADDRKWARWLPELGFTREETGRRVLVCQREQVLPKGAEIFLTPADCDF